MSNAFKRLQRLAGIITEDKQTYDYGCVMLYFDFPSQKKIHSMIDADDVYHQTGDRSYGLENEPHCTLLYGLHDTVSTQDVRDVLAKHTYSPITAKNASLFENPDYDVLKFDCSGDGLHATNSALSEFPHTTDYPDYHPHMTIAYLKPGTGKRYVKLLKGESFDLIPTHAVYSKPDGETDSIKIKVKK